MTHRERVETALNREQPDRCPMQVSFTPEFAVRLRQEMQSRGALSREADGANRKTHNPHGGGNTYELEIALDEDILLTSVGWANSYYQGNGPYRDEWGIEWKPVQYQTRFGTGIYTEIACRPLEDDAALDSYQPPDPNRPELYDEAKWVVDRFKNEYWIVGVTVTTIFETAWALRGLDRLLMDMILNPDIAERILEIPFQYHLAAARNLIRAGVDMIWTGDDVGTQRAMVVSPDLWRRYFKPRMARFFSELRAANPGIWIAYHSDGCIEPIIPDLIEIGLDVLNPIQPACMDPAGLRRKYGNSLCFWGSIDEQHTLPFGTPEEVRSEVIERLRTIGKSGGLIIGPTHHVQLDTPMENFWSMVETIRTTRYADL